MVFAASSVSDRRTVRNWRSNIYPLDGAHEAQKSARHIASLAIAMSVSHSRIFWQSIMGQLVWCTEQDESSLLFIQLKTVDVHLMTNVVNTSNQLLYIIFQCLRVTVEVQLSVVSRMNVLPSCVGVIGLQLICSTHSHYAYDDLLGYA